MSQNNRRPNSADIVVIGAGHAGCEAALAAARMGQRVIVVTPNLDRVGFMPCNPSIGGPGKSHIVAEVDALGGAMAEVADTTAVQTRRLNTSKGPAVQAIRHQVDKTLYSMIMKQRLEEQDGLSLLQDEAIGLALDAGTVAGIELRSRGHIECGAVVVTAGTFLRAAMVSASREFPAPGLATPPTASSPRVCKASVSPPAASRQALRRASTVALSTLPFSNHNLVTLSRRGCPAMGALVGLRQSPFRHRPSTRRSPRCAANDHNLPVFARRPT